MYNARPAEMGLYDASVTGNGRVTAMVRGACCNEQIVLGRSDLKHGGYTGVLQDVSDKFPLVRKLYNDGKILDAEKLLSSEFARKGYHPAPERGLPLAILALDFNVDGLVTGYRRTSDMRSGEVEVTFKHGATTVTRSLFVGRNNDIIAYSVAKSGTDRISAVFSLKTPEGITLQNAVTRYEGGFAYFAARSGGGQDYGLVARIMTSTGTAEHSESALSLKNSEGFTLYVKTFVNSNRDTEFKNLKNELAALKTYDKIFASHETAHKKLFDGCTLELAGAEDVKEDFAGVLSRVHSAELDTPVISRLWNFAKYLAICGVPADGVSFNNSAQLLYSGIMTSILPDNVLSLFDLYEQYEDDLKKNAARVFGMKGYFVPSVISPKSALFGAVDAGTIHFIASSALAANLFYRYYQVTGDVKTLKSRIFPFMREVCAFYSDFLKLDSNGYYSTIPSYSPLSTPGNAIAGRPLKNFAFATNSTIDFLALGCLLDNLCEAAEVCGGSTDAVMWVDMKTKIPPLAVNDAGAVREYTGSAFIDGLVNCGTMHAYGLWPLKNVSFREVLAPYRPPVVQGAAVQNLTMGIRKASYNAVISRLARSGTLQDARSLAICAAQAAHAGLGEVSSAEVRGILLKLLTSCFTGGGLCLSTDWRGGGFTRAAKPEIDVCGNMGFATAVTECIVQSDRRTLRVCPSLFGGILAGKIVDIATDFAARVSVDWDARKGRCVVRIMPKKNCKIDIEVSEHFRRFKGKEKFDKVTGSIKDFALVAARVSVIEFS